MEFEFDPEKAKANPLNHEGVTFEEAKPVLLDPYALTREDLDAKGEQRFVSLGMGGKSRILVAVWTLRGERIRIISACGSARERALAVDLLEKRLHDRVGGKQLSPGKPGSYGPRFASGVS